VVVQACGGFHHAQLVEIFDLLKHRPSSTEFTLHMVVYSCVSRVRANNKVVVADSQK
jgi:hypothetical protein